MARSRNIKPGFFHNDLLVELPFEVRLLFVGLWTIADRSGRMLDRAKKIRMEVFPADNVDVEAGLSLLEKSGFIIRYEAEDARIIQVLNWGKHQSPHYKETVSCLPAHPSMSSEPEASPRQAPDEPEASPRQAPDEPEASPRQAPSQPQSSRPDTGYLIPDSGFLIPDSGYLIPDTEAPASTSEALSENPTDDGKQARPASVISTAGRKRRPTVALSSDAWEAYGGAYRRRYGVDPVRNATVSSQLANFVKRIGNDEAPKVAAFYVSHAGRLYVQAMHPLNLLVRDAEKLRTEWATGCIQTETKARNSDRLAEQGAVWDRLIQANEVQGGH